MAKTAKAKKKRGRLASLRGISADPPPPEVDPTPADGIHILVGARAMVTDIAETLTLNGEDYGDLLYAAERIDRGIEILRAALGAAAAGSRHASRRG